MPKETYLPRFSLIIKRLEKSPATYKQINDHLQRESELQGYDYTISLRTLQRDIKDIYKQYKIEIANEKKGEKKYYIKSKPEMQEHSQRLLESYQMINVIEASQDYAEHIFLETRKPNGLEHFYGLLHAIKNKKVVKLAYTKFHNDEISIRTLHPLALKESQHRWYLIANDTNDEHIKTYGLDRIEDLEITKTGFKKPDKLMIEEEFKHYFGIMNSPDKKPEKVVLSLTYHQGQYLKTFPLHKSQKIKTESKEEDEIIIELFIAVTDDFVMELLSLGPDLEVKSPAKLRKIMEKNLTKTLQYYRS